MTSDPPFLLSEIQTRLKISIYAKTKIENGAVTLYKVESHGKQLGN